MLTREGLDNSGSRKSEFYQASIGGWDYGINEVVSQWYYHRYGKQAVTIVHLSECYCSSRASLTRINNTEQKHSRKTTVSQSRVSQSRGVLRQWQIQRDAGLILSKKRKKITEARKVGGASKTKPPGLISELVYSLHKETHTHVSFTTHGRGKVKIPDQTLGSIMDHLMT